MMCACKEVCRVRQKCVGVAVGQGFVRWPVGERVPPKAYEVPPEIMEYNRNIITYNCLKRQSRPGNRKANVDHLGTFTFT
jgi:hypothetical protein